MQKKGGYFVLKVFDCFMQHTIDLIYLLTSFYRKIYIYKPNTSRLANSEKYIVCKDFLFENSNEFSPYLYNLFYNMIHSKKIIHRFLNIDVPNYFINKIEEYNCILGQQQIENIYNTISLPKSHSPPIFTSHLKNYSYAQLLGIIKKTIYSPLL